MAKRIRDTREIKIAGAGLAGSLLATYLANRGFRVTVYERRPDLRKVDISAGRSINLALANRGIRALAGVGVMESVEEELIPMAGRMLHDENGDLRFSPYGNKPEEVIHSVSRGGLNAILMDAAEATGRVEIRFGVSCRGVDFERGEVTLRDETTRETRTEPFEVLVGADGAPSRVRGSIIEATGGDFEEEPLEHAYKELEIPAALDGRFRMVHGALHIWPRGGYMLIALPNADRTFTVTLFLPREGRESFATLTDPEAVEELFRARFPDAFDLMPHLTRDFFENPTGHLATIRCSAWHHREALILGDAAHAIVPFHGQGMNCAFEDCADLDAVLAEGPDTWEEAFAEFEAKRKPNADAIADMALENYVEMRDTVTDESYHMKKDLGFKLEERHPNRFVPRYSMVMFHHVPYAEAMRRGRINQEILDRLINGIETPGEADLELADRLIQERLEEFRVLD
jgi:kynurenine 3-monooxygenase